MSDYLKRKKIEDKVRVILEKRFGVALPERPVMIGYGPDGRTLNYKFDLVSPSGDIVGEVKSIGPRKSGKKPHIKIAQTSEACLLLLNAKGAKRLILVLTDEDFYNIYIKTRQAMITSKQIEILHISVK